MLSGEGCLTLKSAGAEGEGGGGALRGDDGCRHRREDLQALITTRICGIWRLQGWEGALGWTTAKRG